MAIESVRRRGDGKLVQVVDGNPSVVIDDAKHPARKALAAWERAGGVIQDAVAKAAPEPVVNVEDILIEAGVFADRAAWDAARAAALAKKTP